MTDFKTVLLKEIHPDPNQPRKFTDELAMAELTQSVKEKGVLQPILLRPNGNGYILVCGERRYRASIDAGLSDIPAVIRQLSDDEALELQIIENLQRKDVNPMEEGTAFKTLTQRFSVDEIGKRVGKSAGYVVQRMKLCDLIPEFQDLLFADRMKLGLAFQVARLVDKSQREIYKEARVPKDWAKKKDWEIPSWIRIENHANNLDEASFKTEDPDLYPEMGPCNKCPHNSHFNKLLFPDLQRKRICHNGICFDIKSSRGYQKQIEVAMQDPEVIFISNSWSIGNEEKRKISAAEQLGAKVIDHDLIEVVDAPEAPESWEVFLKEQKEDEYWDDLTEKERKELLKEWKSDHAQLLEDFKQDLKELEKARTSGLLKKAFVVTGSEEGKFVDVKIKAKKGIGKENAEAGGNVDVMMIRSEIAEIHQREDRNKELDREKVYKLMVELFKLEGNVYLKNEEQLSPDEWAAVLLSLSEQSYQVRDLLEEELNVPHDYSGIKLYEAIYKNERVQVLHKALRLFIHDKLINVNEADYKKRGKAAAMYALGEQYFKNELDGFEGDQKIRADKRSANVQKRLELLEQKEAELQAASKPAKATKPKSSKKHKS